MPNFRSRYLVAGIALLQFVHAIPSSLATRSTTRYLATFEDIPVVDPVASTQLINIYDNVFFRAFELISQGTNGVISGIPVAGEVTGPVTGAAPNVGTGVIPHSRYRAGGFSVVTRTEQGTPSLTTVYEGSSPTKRITPISFWWGAALKSQQSVASLPQNAQLTVVGYNATENAVAVKRFDYDFTGATQEMVFAELDSSFKNLRHVDFAIDAVAAGIGVVTLIDDVDFIVSQ